RDDRLAVGRQRESAVDEAARHVAPNGGYTLSAVQDLEFLVITSSRGAHLDCAHPFAGTHEVRLGSDIDDRERPGWRLGAEGERQLVQERSVELALGMNLGPELLPPSDRAAVATEAHVPNGGAVAAGAHLLATGAELPDRETEVISAGRGHPFAVRRKCRDEHDVVVTTVGGHEATRVDVNHMAGEVSAGSGDEDMQTVGADAQAGDGNLQFGQYLEQRARGRVENAHRAVRAGRQDRA